MKVQRQLAVMGWHCITVWECQLKPAVREQTLESLVFTLNHIFLQDHRIRTYEWPDEEATVALAAEGDWADPKDPRTAEEGSDPDQGKQPNERMKER